MVLPSAAHVAYVRVFSSDRRFDSLAFQWIACSDTASILPSRWSAPSLPLKLFDQVLRVQMGSILIPRGRWSKDQQAGHLQTRTVSYCREFVGILGRKVFVVSLSTAGTCTEKSAGRSTRFEAVMKRIDIWHVATQAQL
jgi:hypothetical protein